MDCTQNRNLHGWLPQRPDPRDTPYSALRAPSRLRALMLPKVVDLRTTGFMPPVYDQGNLGSCGPNAACAAAAFVEAKEGNREDNGPYAFSRLALYYDVRRWYGKENEDTGVFIRDLFKSVKRTGLALEKRWPYDVSKFAVYPALDALHEGYHRHRDIEYFAVSEHAERLDCLAQGYPIIYGMTLFDSFNRLTVQHPFLELPTRNDSVIGGHAMVIVGYALSLKCYLVRNSWGPGWCMSGYFWLPFEYAEACASDYWTLRKLAA